MVCSLRSSDPGVAGTHQPSPLPILSQRKEEGKAVVEKDEYLDLELRVKNLEQINLIDKNGIRCVSINR